MVDTKPPGWRVSTGCRFRQIAECLALDLCRQRLLCAGLPKWAQGSQCKTSRCRDCGITFLHTRDTPSPVLSVTKKNVTTMFLWDMLLKASSRRKVSCCVDWRHWTHRHSFTQARSCAWRRLTAPILSCHQTYITEHSFALLWFYRILHRFTE